MKEMKRYSVNVWRARNKLLLTDLRAWKSRASAAEQIAEKSRLRILALEAARDAFLTKGRDAMDMSDERVVGIVLEMKNLVDRHGGMDGHHLAEFNALADDLLSSASIPPIQETGNEEPNHG